MKRDVYMPGLHGWIPCLDYMPGSSSYKTVITVVIVL